jgi:hypothetical protein
MKKYLVKSFILATMLFISIVSLMVISSCSDGDDPDPVDPLEEKANLIVDTWNIANNGVTAPADASSLEWSNLSITISGDKSGGPISASGVPDCGEAVWPDSEVWAFSNSDGSKMMRGDDVEMTIVTATESTLTLSFPIVFDPPQPDPTTAFLEVFDYPNDTDVRNDIEYGENIFVEWPVADACDPVSGGEVSIEDGALLWTWTEACEAAVGWEFDPPLNISSNPNLSFKYKFPVGTIFSVYMFSEAGEGQLFAPDDYVLILGDDDWNEVTIDLSKSSSLEGSDPNTTEMDKFYGFYLIAGLTVPDSDPPVLIEGATGSKLYFDDVAVGDVSDCGTVSLSGDWTFTFNK